MTSASLISKKTYWIVVANESSAIVYAQDKRRGPLREMFSLHNEAARKKTADLISDRGGRSFDSHGQGRHTMVKEKTDPKKHASIMFAKEITYRISKAQHKGSCRGFALIAAPRFLGVLRDALSMSANADPFFTVDKDIVGQDTDFIEKLLSGH